MKKILTLLFLLNALVGFAQTSTAIIICDSVNSERAYCAAITGINNSTLPLFGPGVNSGGGYSSDDLFKTDFTSLPTTITIDSAFLELSPDSNWNNINPGGTEDNAVFIQQITSSWNQQTVTYATEPTIITTNQISLAPSINQFQFTKLNVTSWVQSWVANPSTNFGIKMSPQHTSGTSIRRYCWASSRAVKQNWRPTYKIYYKTILGVADVKTNNNQLNYDFENQNLVVSFKCEKAQTITLNLYDINGREITSLMKQNEAAGLKISKSFNISNLNLARGVYIVSLFMDGQRINKKIIL